MRILAVLILAGALAGCAPTVRVATAAPAPPSAHLAVINTLGVAVNVYLVHDGAEQLLGQVGSNTQRTLPMFGVQPGTQVTLKATRADGSTTYTRADYRLERESSWTIP